ncbi:hypothetical protein JCM11251_002690 [Rhodosporidiobolus azoricus]
MAPIDLDKKQRIEAEKSQQSSVTEEQFQRRTQPKQEDSSAFTEADWALDKAALRRLDITVLPLCALTYFFNFLDRSNLGNAKVAGLASDLNLSSHQYLVALTCSYVLYIAFEFPSNMLLKKVGANYMIPLMVVTWGLCCTFTGFVHSYGGLVAVRLMLGLCEGGLFPGLVLYLSMFYRRRELQTRISLFFGAASLSGAFSGLLAAAIINMDGVGGKAGWRWIFYLEGAVTVLFGFALYFLLPATPSQARFLTPEQKAHVERRLRLDSPAGSNDFEEHFSWTEVFQAVKSPQVILLFIALFGNGLTLYSMSYFTPTIVGTFGYTTVQTQLLTVPPFVLAFIVTLINAWFSDRYGRRGLCAILMSFLALAGYIMFYKSLSTAVRYTSLFMVITGVYSTSPALVTWLPNNSAPAYRKATAIALGFIATNSGGIAGTWLFPANEGPQYATGCKVLISMTVLIILFCCLNLLYLRRENRQKAVQRDIDEANGREIDPNEWKALGDKHQNFEYSM